MLFFKTKIFNCWPFAYLNHNNKHARVKLWRAAWLSPQHEVILPLLSKFSKHFHPSTGMKQLRVVWAELCIKHQSTAPESCSWHRFLNWVVCSHVCWQSWSSFALLKQCLFHYREMIYLNPAAGFFLNSTVWKLFVSVWIQKMGTVVLVMGRRACRPFVLTVRKLLSQTEGCFLRTACQLSLKTQMHVCVCVHVFLVTNWPLPRIFGCLIACGQLIKHCMLLKVWTCHFVVLASLTSSTELYHSSFPMWGLVHECQQKKSCSEIKNVGVRGAFPSQVVIIHSVVIKQIRLLLSRSPNSEQ